MNLFMGGCQRVYISGKGGVFKVIDIFAGRCFMWGDPVIITLKKGYKKHRGIFRGFDEKDEKISIFNQELDCIERISMKEIEDISWG
jgi:hypothetical protein